MPLDTLLCAAVQVLVHGMVQQLQSYTSGLYFGGANFHHPDFCRRSELTSLILIFIFFYRDGQLIRHVFDR